MSESFKGFAISWTKDRYSAHLCVQFSQITAEFAQVDEENALEQLMGLINSKWGSAQG
jgi:hypothetical protein